MIILFMFAEKMFEDVKVYTFLTIHHFDNTNHVVSKVCNRCKQMFYVCEQYTIPSAEYMIYPGSLLRAQGVFSVNVSGQSFQPRQVFLNYEYVNTIHATQYQLECILIMLSCNDYVLCSLVMALILMILRNSMKRILLDISFINKELWIC